MRNPPTLSKTPSRFVYVQSEGRSEVADIDRVWAALRRRPHPFFRRAGGVRLVSGRWSFLASDPTEVLTSDRVPVRESADPFRALANVWPSPVAGRRLTVPFAGGFAGFIGYEARSAVERTPKPRLPPDGFPTFWLGRYDAVVAYDHDTRRIYATGMGATRRRAKAAVERLQARISDGHAARRTEGRELAVRGPAPRPVVSAAAYRRRVAEARRRIGRGDLFQANVSQRFDGFWNGPATALFDRLTAASPAPFATYVDVGRGRTVLSTSPERFLSARGDHLETRPMKGTRRRGATRAEDRRLERDLLTSEKERAELAMIVDLSRNDLSRSCVPGTVRVETPRRLERYAGVHQAVGIVTGRLATGVHRADAIRHAFPPGSVTGAPKVEAMNVIDALENEARGPYCGVVGWFDEGGDFDLAVAIRTVCLVGSDPSFRLSYRVGGGVTWLSDPEAERLETLDKGAAIARAVTGGPRS